MFLDFRGRGVRLRMWDFMMRGLCEYSFEKRLYAMIADECSVEWAKANIAGFG